MTIHWHPCNLLNNKSAYNYAVIILNQPINRNAFDAVIGGAAVLVCADAGADRLFEHNQTPLSGLTQRLPDAIVGDLDSLSPEVENYYRSRGVEVVRDPDQNSTDFTKCLKWIRRASTTLQSSTEGTLDVIVLGGLGGRVDQGFSQIHHLYMAINDPELLQGQIYLLSQQSLSFVLGNGTNVIHIESRDFEENVGIIPILGPMRIWTKGLEWDVEDWVTEFGGQISTSNHIRSDKIEVAFEGGRPLFTMELAKHLAVP